MGSVRRRKPGKFNLEKFLSAAGNGRRTVACARRAIIFSQGSPGRYVYFIRSGGVKLTVSSPEGKEAVVGILGPGDFFGEGGMHGEKVYTVTAAAILDCQLVRIHSRWLTDAIHRERPFCEYFFAYLLAQRNRMQSDLVDHIFLSSEKRLARLLLVLSRRINSGKPESALPKISQETLANMVGTTRSRVSYFMNKFRKLGYIRYNGTLQVADSLAKILGE